MMSHLLAMAKRDLKWDDIWLNQGVSSPFERQIASIAESVLEVLTDDRREQRNISEWAKSESCWVQVKQLPLSLSDEFLTQTTPISASQLRSEKAEVREQGKILGELELLAHLISIPSEVWNEFRTSPRYRVSERERGILQQLQKTGVLSYAQSKALMQALTRAQEEGLVV